MDLMDPPYPRKMGRRGKRFDWVGIIFGSLAERRAERRSELRVWWNVDVSVMTQRRRNAEESVK